MEFLWSFVVVAQVLSAIGVIVLVLIQHGKGADMGAAFGSGASGSLFGATGSANFLSRTTAACAAVFFVSTLALAFASQRSPSAPSSVMDQPASSVPVPSSLPAAPAGTGGGAPASAGSGAAPAQGGPAGQIPK
ncbi:MAG TPA: preprotein translocase subunit SecG [Burkholderiaceae bacterium]